MKLQHLTVIFIIIILPITLVLSEYISGHVTTIRRQTQYSTKLLNATYDAVKAFQLNTAYNSYSTIGNSKIRDIESAIKVFYTSMGKSMKINGYTSNDIKDHTPAILCTLYDGYYIYTSYYDTELGEYTYGLKPFISYSCRYKKGSTDVVVNYTLDNTITVIGYINGTYETRTGHLIDLNTYKNDIQGEVLTENLTTLEYDSGTNEYIPTTENYEYIIYNNQKIYYDKNVYNSTGRENYKYFYYGSDYRKNYLNTAADINDINSNYFISGHLVSNSAKKYYEEAKTFTEWVKQASVLGNITADDAVDVNGNKITDFATDLSGKKIFVTSSTNDPLSSSSIFNEHRMNVIRKSIETNLVPAIANYNRHSTTGYEFLMPKLGEKDWYTITNNVCMISFLQGLPIGSKMYNNYAVVSNNSNQESIGTNSIYIITEDASGNREYHRPGCKNLIDGLANGILKYVGAYSSSDFARKSVSTTGELYGSSEQLNGSSEAGTYYFFPQSAALCYDCLVMSTSNVYSADDIIDGSASGGNASKNIQTVTGKTTTLQKEYLTALARARYDLYTVNGYFGVN